MIYILHPLKLQFKFPDLIIEKPMLEQWPQHLPAISFFDVAEESVNQWLGDFIGMSICTFIYFCDNLTFYNFGDKFASEIVHIC